MSATLGGITHRVTLSWRMYWASRPSLWRQTNPGVLPMSKQHPYGGETVADAITWLWDKGAHFVLLKRNGTPLRIEWRYKAEKEEALTWKRGGGRLGIIPWTLGLTVIRFTNLQTFEHVMETYPPFMWADVGEPYYCFYRDLEERNWNSTWRLDAQHEGEVVGHGYVELHEEIIQDLARSFGTVFSMTDAERGDVMFPAEHWRGPTDYTNKSLRQNEGPLSIHRFYSNIFEDPHCKERDWRVDNWGDMIEHAEQTGHDIYFTLRSHYSLSGRRIIAPTVEDWLKDHPDLKTFRPLAIPDAFDDIILEEPEDDGIVTYRGRLGNLWVFAGGWDAFKAHADANLDAAIEIGDMAFPGGRAGLEVVTGKRGMGKSVWAETVIANVKATQPEARILTNYALPQLCDFYLPSLAEVLANMPQCELLAYLGSDVGVVLLDVEVDVLGAGYSPVRPLKAERIKVINELGFSVLITTPTPNNLNVDLRDGAQRYVAVWGVSTEGKYVEFDYSDGETK